MKEDRKALINQFQRILDTKLRRQIIAAECANIAERYAEQCNIHRIGKCFSEDEMQKEYENGFNDGNQRDFTI